MKPLLVGETNPYSGDDHEFALYPSPEGSAGHRLCVDILGLGRKDYLERFDRANLCGGTWRIGAARDVAERIKHEHKGDRAFILLGAKVREAFGIWEAAFTVATRYWDLQPGPLREWVHTYYLLPHPSGRCRAWNEPGAVARARALLKEFL